MSAHPIRTGHWNVMAQAEVPPSVLFGETEPDMFHYRVRTIALLRRYGRASVEVGRLPSLLGRWFFRSRMTSYAMANFEDVVIFVTDMEHAIQALDPLEKKLLGMNVLEEYSIPEVARLLGFPQRTVARLLEETLDRLGGAAGGGNFVKRVKITISGEVVQIRGKINTTIHLTTFVSSE